MCNLASNMIYRYENDLSDPTSGSLKIIAEKLNTSADYLIGLSDNPALRLLEVDLDSEEQNMVDTFRREGWPGVIRLGGERLSK